MKPPSGKFIVRLDPALHAQLQNMSHERHLSINQLCVNQIKALTGASPASTSGVRFGIPEVELKNLLESSGCKVQGCVLFGSAARGELTSKSDLDLLLVLEPGESPSRDVYSLWEKKVEPFLKTKLAREVSPQFVALPESFADAGGIWYETAIHGLILWEEANAISIFLGRLREWIAAGKAQRKLSHGQPYWIRNLAEDSDEK